MIGQETLNDECDAQQRRNEDRAEAFNERVSDYECFIWGDEGEMLEVFNDFYHRKGFLEEYCAMKKKGLNATALQYLDDCLQKTVHNYAVMACEENN